MRIHFSQTEYTQSIGPGIPQGMKYRDWAELTYRACPLGRHQIVDSPEDADILIIWEPDQKGEFPQRVMLRRHPFVTDYPEKVYVANFEDGPKPLIPGAYTSFSRKNFDYSRIRAIGYPLQLNNRIEANYCAGRTVPAKLCSFYGAETHEVRKQLYLLGSKYKEITDIQKTGRHVFFNEGERVDQMRDAYAQSILKSYFSLCPRGASPSSYRIFESMQLGRAPVIISDEWMEPSGPSWREFSIRVAESKITELPVLLKDRQHLWYEMGLNARKAWETWFSPEIIVHRIVEEIADLHLQKSVNEVSYRKERWPVLLDLKKNGCQKADAKWKSALKKTCRRIFG